MNKSTWAIGNDLEGVIETTDSFGQFATELEAQTRLVHMLLGEKSDIARKLGKARRRQTYLQRKAIKAQEREETNGIR